MGRPLSARSPYPGHSAAHPLNRQGHCCVPKDQEKTHVLVMGITGKVAAQRQNICWAQGKKDRALVRKSRKGGNWADQGVELVDGDWNDSGSHRSRRSKALRRLCHVAGVWAPSPDLQEAKGVIANYVEALITAAAASGKRSRRWAPTEPRARDDHGVVASEQGFATLTSPVHLCAAQADSSKTPFTVLQVAQGGMLPVYL